MVPEIEYCVTCEGIRLYWNPCTQEWTALYVDGGGYCECPELDLTA